MRAAVVVLNWNTVGYLRSFVPGILESLGPDDCLAVADSGSTDGSLEFLEKEFPQVLRIPLGRNYGFAGGYNRALEGLDAEYYVLLNTDVAVDREWLKELTSFMNSHPDCAVCGPKLHALEVSEGSFKRTSRFEYAGAAGGFLDYYGFPFCRGRVLHRVEDDHGQYDDCPGGVFWISGAALMIRSRVWKELGGFDGEFFAHMEEIDLCWRAHLAGYGVSVVPSATVWHIGGGTLNTTSPLKLKLNYRNSLWMLEKNLPCSIGSRRASVRIFFRKCIDGLSAAVYLLTLRPAYFNSVLQAHMEASRREITPSCGIQTPLPRVRIIPASILFGKRVFNYLRKYENCH